MIEKLGFGIHQILARLFGALFYHVGINMNDLQCFPPFLLDALSTSPCEHKHKTSINRSQLMSRDN
jgi:hypothetical protein